MEPTTSATTTLEHDDKENIPPNSPPKPSDPVPKTSKKPKRKFKKMLRKPLADITHLYENSAAQTQSGSASGSAQDGGADSANFLASSASGVSTQQPKSAKKRKAVDVDNDDDDDDDKGEKLKSKSLRMGFR